MYRPLIYLMLILLAGCSDQRSKDTIADAPSGNSSPKSEDRDTSLVVWTEDMDDEIVRKSPTPELIEKAIRELNWNYKQYPPRVYIHRDEESCWVCGSEAGWVCGGG